MQQLRLFEHPAPGTTHAAPGTRDAAPGTRHPAPGTRHQAQGTGHQAHGTGHQAHGTGHQAHGTRHPAPPIRPVFVRHPRARRYIVRITHDGTVRVTIPRWGSKREAQSFADSQHAWIDRQLAKWIEEQSRPREVVPPGAVRELRLRAKRELPTRLLELAAAHGLVVSRVTIRNQRWRWGSCSRSGHICLNWRLVTMPAWVRDYVLIHELMHLKRLDHSRVFWTLVAAACPNFRAARDWLRKHSSLQS